MGITYNPRIVTDGLVLALDAANTKSYGNNTENLLSTSIRTTDGNGATSGSGWTLTANNAASPDGTTTATLLTQTSSLSNSGILWLGGGNSAGQVMSIFCKPVSGNAVLQGQTGNGDGWTANLSTNVFTDSSGGRHANGGVDVYPDGWKRVIIPMVSIPPFSGGGSFPGGDFYLTVQGIGSVLLWGWQRENGSTANSYYPTTGTAKTRGTTWTDLSGRGNTGTLTNGPTYSNTNGGSIVFDGTDDYVEITGNSSNTPSEMTLFCFVYPKNTRPEEIIATQNSGNGYRFMTRTYVGGGGTTWGFAPSSATEYSSSTVLSNNVWYSLAITYTSSSLLGYLNGALNWSVSSPIALVHGGNIRLGDGIGGAQVHLQANLSSFMMYNRALSAAEVSQNFNALRGRYGI